MNVWTSIVHHVRTSHSIPRVFNAPCTTVKQVQGRPFSTFDSLMVAAAQREDSTQHFDGNFPTNEWSSSHVETKCFSLLVLFCEKNIHIWNNGIAFTWISCIEYISNEIECLTLTALAQNWWFFFLSTSQLTFNLIWTHNFIVISEWTLGTFICKTVSYMQGVSVSASVNTLMAISIERCVAISCPYVSITPRYRNAHCAHATFILN